MRIARLVFFYALILLIPLKKGRAQSAAGDSLLRKASAEYLQLMKQQASLYNGAEYLAPRQIIEGFPFFGQEQFYQGKIVSSGVSYFDVPIHYDLVRDALLIWSYDRSILLMLNSEKIERFQLGKESFIRGSLVKQKDNEARKGFFQVIHEGKHLAVSKKQKVIVQKSASDKSYAFYKQFNTYYIVIDGKWNEVVSRKSVLNILKLHKEALKNFINKEKLNFHKSPEYFLNKVMGYYELLNG